MIHKGLRVGLVLAVLVGVFALVPAVSADENPCTGKVVHMPADVAWGSSFEVIWDQVPGAASYAMTVVHADGDAFFFVAYTTDTSWTVSTNWIDGPQAVITVNALTPEGDVLCSMGGTVGLTHTTSEEEALTVHAPPTETTEVPVYESAADAARIAAGAVPVLILDLLGSPSPEYGYFW